MLFSRRSKIALLSPTLVTFAGSDRVVVNEALRYAKDYKVTIFTFKAETELVEKLSKKSIKVEILGMPRNPFLERLYRLFFFLDIWKIDKIVENLKGYDEVISFLYPMTIPADIVKTKKPQIKYTYYDVGVAYPELFDGFFQKNYMRLFSFFTAKTVKKADAAISISEFSREQLKKQTGLNSQVFEVKIDKKRFNTNVNKRYGKEIKSIREKYGLNGEVLLYVGRISPHKGIHLLLDAFKSVRQSFNNAKLIIIGKPTFSGYYKKVKEKGSKIGNVIFTGFVPDEELPAYYATCDVYVTCSGWECFDMPIVEANYCGKPAVAFNIGSHSEVLKKGGLIKENDIERFSDKVIELLNKKPVRMMEVKKLKTPNVNKIYQSFSTSVPYVTASNR